MLKKVSILVPVISLCLVVNAFAALPAQSNGVYNPNNYSSFISAPTGGVEAIDLQQQMILAQQQYAALQAQALQAQQLAALQAQQLAAQQIAVPQTIVPQAGMIIASNATSAIQPN